MRPLVLTAGFTLALTAAASAHAFLKSAQPAVGSTVPAAPAQVTITFTEAVEPRFSTIAVQDGAGAAADDGHVTASAPDRLAVGLKPLAPGRYKVTWHVTAVDTHKTEGSFTFTVAP